MSRERAREGAGRPPRWVLPAAWVACILVMATDLGSGQTTGTLLGPIFDWLALGPQASAVVHGLLRAAGHVAAYALFAFLVWWAAMPSIVWPMRLALLLSLLLSAVDESLQASATDARVGDLADVVLDVGAASCCLAVLSVVLRLRARRLSEPVAREP